MDDIQNEPEKPQAKAEPATSLLLAGPVRSGQSVVFTEGDVTVLGSVASGAEIFAGGHPRLRDVTRASDGGRQRQCSRADLFSEEDRSRTPCYRRLRPDRRGH